MRSKHAFHIVETAAPHGRSHSQPHSHARYDQQRSDVLHQISLLALRSNDIHTVIPDIARLLYSALHLQTVGIVLHDDGWVIQDDHGTDASRPTPATAAASSKAEFSWHEDATGDGSSHRVELISHDATVGFIVVRGVEQGPASNRVTDILDQVGEVLVEASERLRQADAVDIGQLLEITSQLATLTDVDMDIQPLLADIASLVRADLVSLVVSDPMQPDLFVNDPVWHTSSDALMHRLVAAPAVREAVDTGALQVGAIEPSSAYPKEPLSQLLAVPLVAHGESVGLLAIERDGDRAFSCSESEAGEMVARHLSYCLDRTRRVRGYSRQNLLLSLVERVTAFIARSTDDDDLLAQMAREIRRTFGYDCSIALIIDDRLIFRALELGSPDLIPDWIDQGIPLEVGVMGRVARTGQPIFVRNVKSDTSFVDIGRNSVSEIAVPIRSGDEVVGVLNVESGADNPLQNLDFEILLILANHIGIALGNRQLIAAERESRMEIEAIQRVSTIVAEALDPEESLRLMAATLADVLHYPVVSLALLEGRWLIRKANYGYDPDTHSGVMGVAEGISGRVARTGIPVFLENVNEDAGYVRQREDLTSEVCVPIRCGGEIVGVLNVEGTRERPVTERDLHLLTTFAEHAGVLLNNARAYAELSREATLDPMTGVPNLRYFQQQLHEEFRQAQRDDKEFSLAVIDLDDLKEINDTYGHLVGDQVLRELASRMNGQLRDIDLLARYAGDEFVAILPNVDERRALKIAEQLLDAARSCPFQAENDAKINLSLSIGIASYPCDGGSSTGLLQAADMAMYVAKESGKNRASSAGQSEHIRRRSNG